MQQHLCVYFFFQLCHKQSLGNLVCVPLRFCSPTQKLTQTQNDYGCFFKINKSAFRNLMKLNRKKQNTYQTEIEIWNNI